MHVGVCCFIEHLCGWPCRQKIKPTVAREMERVQNDIRVKKGGLGDILKAFGFGPGCTLMVLATNRKERRQKPGSIGSK